MISHRWFTVAALLAVASLALAPSSAQAATVLDITGGYAASPMGDTIAGWSFEVTSAIMIDGLALWDEGANGLVNSHDVGLWNADGSVLLASATVDGSATPDASTSTDGCWLWTSIESITLTPGVYVMGATFKDVDADLARLQASATTVAGVTYLNARQKTLTSSLAYPDWEISDLNAGIFGANMHIADVPEPGALALLAGFGLPAALFGARKLRRR